MRLGLQESQVNLEFLNFSEVCGAPEIPARPLARAAGPEAHTTLAQSRHQYTTYPCATARSARLSTSCNRS